MGARLKAMAHPASGRREGARPLRVTALGALVALTVVLACAACSGHEDGTAPRAIASAAPFVLVSGTAAPSTPRPVRAVGTAVPAPTPRPIAGADDEVWRQIAADTERSLRPLLRPPSLPADLDTVLDTRTPSRANRGAFTVEYAGPGAMLVIAAGALNPPPGFEPGHQDRVTVRGQPGVLAVGDDRDPNMSSWVYWEEPGVWRPEGTEPPRERVLYLVRAQGMSPKELLAFVEALRPWTPE